MTHLLSLPPNSPVLLVSPDTSLLEHLEEWLRAAGYPTHTQPQPHLVRDTILTLQNPATICIDTRLSVDHGMQALSLAETLCPKTPCVLLGSSWSSLPDHVRTMRSFYTCLSTWDQRAAFLQTIQNTTQLFALRDHTERITHVSNPFERFGVVGSSPSMQALYKEMHSAAQTTQTVLLVGERGVGKELIAHALHASSAQHAGPWVIVRCSRSTGAMLDTELFGYEKGSFIGAKTQGVGALERAHQGTLFLDNITALPLALQAKIARAVQYKAFRRIGGRHDIPAHFRVIASVHRSALDSLEHSDLHTNLFADDTSTIFVPPLRQRTMDITHIAQHAVFKHLPSSVQIHKDALQTLMSYTWPHNVRELIEVLQHALRSGDGRSIYRTNLPQSLHTLSSTTTTPNNPSESRLPTLSLEELEKLAIEEALRIHRGNITEAVRHLGISRTTLYRKLSKYHIENSHRTDLM